MSIIVLYSSVPILEVIRWFVYLIARTSMVGCEIEIWYMMELLPRQIHEQVSCYSYIPVTLRKTSFAKGLRVMKVL